MLKVRGKRWNAEKKRQRLLKNIRGDNGRHRRLFQGSYVAVEVDTEGVCLVWVDQSTVDETDFHRLIMGCSTGGFVCCPGSRPRLKHGLTSPPRQHELTKGIPDTSVHTHTQPLLGPLEHHPGWFSSGQSGLVLVVGPS